MVQWEFWGVWNIFTCPARLKLHVDYALFMYIHYLCKILDMVCLKKYSLKEDDRNICAQ